MTIVAALRMGVFMFLLVLVCVTTATAQDTDTPKLRVSFVDVGQGDAIWVHGPDEEDGTPGGNLIIDGGVGLIRFRGHLPKGGYDVPTDGRHPQAPAAPAIH
jgi:hypothetical protein